MRGGVNEYRDKAISFSKEGGLICQMVKDRGVEAVISGARGRVEIVSVPIAGQKFLTKEVFLAMR